MPLRQRRGQLMFVTGGTGLLGRHLLQTTAVERWQVLAPTSAALDISRRDDVLTSITTWKPKVVVHLAYRKGDRRSIVDGTRNVAEAAARCGARLIHLSSDVIFPGRQAPYTEMDIPFPINDYARMKVDAEAAVVESGASAVMIRTSLLYGTDIISLPQIDVRDALAGHSNMSFFTNEYRSPLHAGDLADAIVMLATMPEVVGPLHIAGPEALSRAELAAAIARWLGSNPALLRTGEAPSGGFDRPGRVVLDSSRAAALGIRCRPIAEAMR